MYSPIIGGIEKIVQDIAEGLNSRADMSVLVCREKGAAIEDLYNSVRVTRAKSLGVFNSLPVSFDFFRRFRKMSRDADIIQLHVPFPLVDIALTFIKPKAKIVLWWHSDIIRQRRLLKLLKPFIEHTLKRADLIIAASEGNISSSAFLPKYRAKCALIPFGLDFPQYLESAETRFLTEKLSEQHSCKLLFVGRLVYYKGIDVLIRAMETVSGAELFVVGNGALETELKAEVAANGLSGKVHFLNSLPREQLLQAFRDCDIFVFPSVANSEAFGLVQLEAMYYGKPVINTNLPTGVPYVSVDGETGITVEPGSAEELSGAISLLVDDKELRETYGRNAAKRVREEFSLTDMLDKLYARYEEILSE
jgi:rhamnosyl/mannosyltransferase